MPRFAANLTMLFGELPFIERFDHAARVGFETVEFLFPYDEDVSQLRGALTRNGLRQVLFKGMVRRHLDRIAHVQIADSPGRHQPGPGEINFPSALTEIDRMGYAGWASLEYQPAGSTEQSLGWLRDWGYWE